MISYIIKIENEESNSNLNRKDMVVNEVIVLRMGKKRNIKSCIFILNIIFIIVSKKY